jgi:hypothetical protein
MVLGGLLRCAIRNVLGNLEFTVVQWLCARSPKFCSSSLNAGIEFSGDLD